MKQIQNLNGWQMVALVGLLLAFLFGVLLVGGVEALIGALIILFFIVVFAG